MVQITQRSVCRNLALFCHFLAYLSDPGYVLDACKQCPTCKFWDFLIPPAGPAHSTRLPTHLIRVPEEGLELRLPILPRGWATPTLKSFKLCQKHAHIKKVLEKLRWWQFFAQPHNCGGVGRLFTGHFFSEHP